MVGADGRTPLELESGPWEVDGPLPTLRPTGSSVREAKALPGCRAAIARRPIAALASATLATAVVSVIVTAVVVVFWPRRPTLRGSSSPRSVDWDLQNKLPPWLTFIAEGSPQGVALVLGQSLRPDGKPSKLLVDRARHAKKLLVDGTVAKVIVSGGDPAGVGRTEASSMAEVLRSVGIADEQIIQESQALTTAENFWYALRWLPAGTGQLYIVTSDFHMARSTYIAQEVLAAFYGDLERTYRDDPRWDSKSKQYPRLTLHQATVASFCGSDASLNRDSDPKAHITTQSLALRASNELRWLSTMEVSQSLFGAPRSRLQYIWPVQIDVTEDPEHDEHFKQAMAQAALVNSSLWQCKAPPEGKGAELPYPLPLFPQGPDDVPMAA